MVKFIELKTDRSLIKPNFDGYKLALDSVPVIKVDLQSNQYPSISKPSSNQYSFLHTELFSMQNLLVQDPWNRESSYFVGNNLAVYCSMYKESNGRPNPLKIVYEFKNFKKEFFNDGRYNFSLKFISEKFCICCNGENNLFLFDTGDRYKLHEWKLVYCNTIVENTLGFTIKDARLDIFDGKKVINCIFQHIDSKNINHSNQLHWISLSENPENNENKWSSELKDVLLGKGSIYYCAFEPKSSSIILCSNQSYTFLSTENKVKEENESKEKDNLTEEKLADKKDFFYSWTQSEDDIVITFDRIENKCKSDFKIICTDENLSVKCNEEFLLDNIALFDKIDSELTTWSLVNGALEITLMKKDCITWSCFVEGGPLEVSNDIKSNIELEENKPIANLETPVEDCDMAMNTDEEYLIDRINLESKEITHKVRLGSLPPLFSTILRPGFPPAIVTRTDVDASLWLQQYNPSKPDEWTLRHEGNLHAFGYIQASKQQKKYIDCAPDLSYSVISESYRHVFIYNSRYDTANNLRNRNGPQITFGKQNLVSLEQTDEIVGMSCGLNFITLLSEKCLLYIQINKLNS